MKFLCKTALVVSVLPGPVIDTVNDIGASIYGVASLYFKPSRSLVEPPPSVIHTSTDAAAAAAELCMIWRRGDAPEP